MTVQGITPYHNIDEMRQGTSAASNDGQNSFMAELANAQQSGAEETQQAYVSGSASETEITENWLGGAVQALAVQDIQKEMLLQPGQTEYTGIPEGTEKIPWEGSSAEQKIAENLASVHNPYAVPTGVNLLEATQDVEHGPGIDYVMRYQTLDDLRAMGYDG